MNSDFIWGMAIGLLVTWVVTVVAINTGRHNTKQRSKNGK